jgi:hypothetical protein
VEPVVTCADPAAPEQVLACLGSILASPEFSPSPQLSRFLRYVVENGLAGDEAALKETVIGVAVFRRDPSYDTKLDPIVRVEARRLRNRLDAYYRRTASCDPVRISLPKGGYVPLFAPCAKKEEETGPDFEAVDPNVHEDTKVQEIVSTGTQKRRFPFVLVAVLLSAALVGIAASVRQAIEPPGVASRFWSSIFGGDAPALVVPADSGLVMLENLSKITVSLQDYITGEYRLRLARQAPNDPDLAFNLGGRRYTSIADLDFASRLSTSAQNSGHRIAIRYARDVRVDDMKRGSVILLGAKQSNPWVELFERDATLRIEDDETTTALRIVNLAPNPGEPGSILMSPAAMQEDIYGIVTYHRNGGGPGAALVVAGTTVAGTEAAADFVLDDARFEPWLRKAQSPSGFHGFDILLHGRNLAGAAPRAEVVSMHVQR